jgi:hypothetical protein
LWEGGDIVTGSEAFAFTPDGQPIDGWPVEVPDRWVDTSFEGFHDAADLGMDGTTLVIAADRGLVVIEADGATTVGATVERTDLTTGTWLGPDRTGYQFRVVGPAQVMEVAAFDLDGVRPGWPVQLGEWASPPAFLPDGRIAVGAVEAGATRLLVLDRDGVVTSTSDIDVELSIPWSGAGDHLYSSMLVAPDGTLRIVGGDNEVWALDPDGRVIEGWPWIAGSPIEYDGFCGEGDTGCGQMRVGPAIGPQGQVVVALQATGTGGALVAVDPAGQVIDGWPVTLNREGAAFWSVVTGGTGTTYALAIEPEDGGGFSGTILAIDPDSTVRWATTLVEP